MNTIQMSVSGLVMSSSLEEDARLIDFVVQGAGSVLIAGAYWWADPYGWADRVVNSAGNLEPLANGWRIVRPDEIRLTFPSPEPEEQDALGLHRLATDIDRTAYLQQLHALRKWAGPEYEAGIQAWADAFAARPVLDPVAVLAEARHSIPRDVGALRIGGDHTTDILLIDARGDAAVAVGDSWLESLAGQWRSYAEPRPPVAAFLAWVMTQNPHREVSLLGYTVERIGGSLESIAQRSLRSTI